MEATVPNLIKVLRDKTLWPKGFKWDFRDCYACAMGLAAKVFPEVEECPCTYMMEKVFGIDQKTGQEIFVYAHERLALRGVKVEHVEVKPEHVADLLEELV